MKSYLVAATVLVISGCTLFETKAPDIVRVDSGTAWVVERGLVYCYATLAAASCHDEPVIGAETRLIAASHSVAFKPMSELGQVTP